MRSSSSDRPSFGDVVLQATAASSSPSSRTRAGLLANEAHSAAMETIDAIHQPPTVHRAAKVWKKHAGQKKGTPWYNLVNVVAQSNGTVYAALSLLNDNWLVHSISGAHYAGKNGAGVWVLVIIGTVVAAIALRLMYRMMNGREDARPHHKKLVVALLWTQFVTFVIAYVAYVRNHPLMRPGDSSIHLEMGYGLTCAKSVCEYSFIAAVGHMLHSRAITKHQRDPVRDNIMSTAQKQLVFSIVTLFYYVQLGGAMFAELEGWDGQTASQFCFVSITTIGYGNVAPKTAGGRVALMLYMPIGFGIIGYAINSLWGIISGQLSDSVVERFTKLRGRLMGQQPLQHDATKLSRRWKIVMGLFAILGLLFSGALFFVLRENDERGHNWTFFESFWFAFVTLTTIGYGDYVPSPGSNFGFTTFVIIGICVIVSLLTVIGEEVVEQVESNVIALNERLTQATTPGSNRIPPKQLSKQDPDLARAILINNIEQLNTLYAECLDDYDEWRRLLIRNKQRVEQEQQRIEQYRNGTTTTDGSGSSAVAGSTGSSPGGGLSPNDESITTLLGNATSESRRFIGHNFLKIKQRFRKHRHVWSDDLEMKQIDEMRACLGTMQELVSRDEFRRVDSDQLALQRMSAMQDAADDIDIDDEDIQ